jgi:hypothetical protein
LGQGSALDVSVGEGAGQPEAGGPMTDTLFAEYSDLVKARDRRAYECAGSAIIASAFLNLGEVEKAQKTLMEGIAAFQEAALQVEQFHKRQVSSVTTNSKKETQSDGNATAA